MIRDKEGQSWEVTLSGPSYVGRQKDCDVVLPDSKVSRRHARLLPVGRSYVVEDLGSSNGVYVNGQRIERRILRHSDLVEIGDFRMQFIGEPGEDLVGKVVGGYRVIRRIGSGGMGSVYLAEQSSMKRFVALKVLNDELAEDQAFIEDFMNEAKLAGRLNHPNIVRVYDFGKLENTYFIAMEYVDGQTLKDRVDAEGKLPILEVVHITQAIVGALEHAHKNGIVHQDIKPQNIMMTQSGEVKLADLGLARFAGDNPDERHRKVIIGTPHYMSPEQGKRLPADARSDIYSLGASMFHLVTGRVPFDGANSLAIITKHIHQEPPNPKQFDMTLPDGLVNVILRCLQKEPEKRYSGAAEMSKSLAAIEKEVAAAAARSQKRREIGTSIRPKEVGSHRVRHHVAAANAQSMLWMLIGGSALILLFVYVGVNIFVSGGPNIASPEQKVRELLDHAQRALDDGAEITARNQAEEAVREAGTGPLAEEAQALLYRINANRERDAQRKLSLLKNLFERDPETAVPFLRGFINENPGTEAANEARQMIAKSEGGGTTQVTVNDNTPTSVAETGLAPQDAVKKAAELENAGEVARAAAVLRQALRQNPDDQGKQLLEGALKPLLDRSQEKAARVLALADEAIKTGRLADAGAIVTQGLKFAARDEDREALLSRRKTVEDSTRKLLEGVVPRIKGRLAALELTDAANEMQALRQKAGAEALPEEIASAGEVATLARSGLDGLVTAVNASPGKAIEASIQGRKAVFVDVKAADAKMLVVAPKGGDEVTINWAQMDTETLYQLMLIYGAKAKAPSYAALLAARGDYANARRLSAEGGAEMPVVNRYIAANDKDKDKDVQRYLFTGIGDLGAWAVEKGDWQLGKGVIEQRSDTEAVMALRTPLKIMHGFMRVDEKLVFGHGTGFAALRIEAAEGVKAMLYVDDDGGRFEVKSAAGEKVYRLEGGVKEGAEIAMAIVVEHGKIRAFLTGREFPEVEAFGAEALSYTLALEGMGRKFAVKEVAVSGK
jgi:serine/threonine protein kinase